MPLPSLDKTWNFVTNVQLKEKPLPTTGTQQQGSASYGNILYTIKAQLVSWGWTVEGSCDASTYNWGGADLWTDYTKLLWGFTPGDNAASWIVLKRANAAGAGKDFYLLIRLAGEITRDCQEAIIMGAWTAFSGGSVTLTPTNAGKALNLIYDHNVDIEVHVGNYGPRYWLLQPTYYSPALPSSQSRGIDVVVHALRSSDGEVERIVVVSHNVVCAYISFEKVKNPTSGWTHPFMCAWVNRNYTNNQSVLSYSILNDDAVRGSSGLCPYTFGYHDGLWLGLYWGSEAYKDAMLGERISYYNEISGEYTMCPVSLISNSPGCKGHHGFLYDLWWGSIETLVGDTFPGDETQQFVRFGEVIFPWDGSAPLTI